MQSAYTAHKETVITNKDMTKDCISVLKDNQGPRTKDNITAPLLTNVSTLPGKHEHEPRKLCLFSHAVYRVSKTTLLWLAISLILINQF